MTPPYSLTLMVLACLTRYFGVGPNYPTDVGLDGNCRKTWYWNILYLNNIVDTDNMVINLISSL